MTDEEFLQLASAPVAIKMAVSIGIGMLIGLEREWANKEVGIRTFAITALMGMLAAIIGSHFILAGFAGVFLLVLFANGRSLLAERTVEITTSAVLMVNYILGVLVGLGHIFTPVAGAIVMMTLLAWKTELNRFTGGLQPSEIRSAIIFGLIAFVVFPLLPDRYIDPWNLLNPHDVWSSIVAISAISFLNYVFLRVFREKGLYLSAIFGGLVNSTATVAEISSRAQQCGLISKVAGLSLLVTVAMFVRNLVIVAIFSPLSLPAAVIPILAMTFIAAIWIVRNNMNNKEINGTSFSLELDSPISIPKVLWFGFLFLVIQLGGALLTKLFGSYGILATGIFGGLVSSASTTAAAASLASHGTISPSMAGTVTILSSLASTVVNLPILWKVLSSRSEFRRIAFQIVTVMLSGIIIIVSDQYFQFSDFILNR